MITINTNIPSLVAQNNADRVENSLLTTLERLSTGLRINHAADDPAGLIATENLNAEIMGTQKSIENAQRASSIVNVAEASLTEVSDILLSIKQLIHETANSAALSDDERQANQQQIDSYIETINRIGKTSVFNDINLLDGSQDYTLSGSNHSATSHVVNALNSSYTSSFIIKDISFKNSYYGQNLGSYDLDVNFLVSGVQAHYTWSSVSDFISTSNNGDKAALTISGYKGRATVDFSGGLANAAAIAAGINSVKSQTGVSAGLSGGNLVFSSTNYGADAFVSVTGVEPAEVVFTPDNYLLSGAAIGDAGVSITGNDGTHNYYAGYSTAAELSNLINADAGITGVASKLSGSDLVIYSADQNSAAFISVSKTATYYKNGNFANGSAATTSWNTVSDYLTVLNDSDGTINVKGINGNVDVSLASGSWTEASLAAEINKYTASTGVTASAGAGSITFTSTNGAGANFVYVEATDQFSSDIVDSLSFSAVGSGAAIGYSGAEYDRTGASWNEITGITLSSYNGLAVDGSGETQQFYAYTSVSSVSSGSYSGDGGMEFSLDSTVQAASDIILGLPEINATNLGNYTDGKLSDLKSGGTNSLSSGKLFQAADSVDAAITQVASLRGRLGAFNKYTVESTIRTQETKLENLTSARTAIEDADFADEIAALTRQQILKQANVFMMEAINTQQQMILKLLQPLNK